MLISFSIQVYTELEKDMGARCRTVAYLAADSSPRRTSLFEVEMVLKSCVTLRPLSCFFLPLLPFLWHLCAENYPSPYNVQKSRDK